MVMKRMPTTTTAVLLLLVVTAMMTFRFRPASAATTGTYNFGYALLEGDGSNDQLTIKKSGGAGETNLVAVTDK